MRLEEILDAGLDDFRRFVNPLIAERARLHREPVRIVAARDGKLVDLDGHEIEDLHGTQVFGHRNPHVTRAVSGFLGSDAPSWLPSRVSPWSGRLARALCERTGYERAYFGTTGADGVDAAIKLARAATRRPRILGLAGAYHGCTMGACALMNPGPLHDPFGPHLPGAELLPFADVAALECALGRGDVAAVIVEPIQGEGGVRTLPGSYVDALCELAPRHGAILVADEVQTGLGRTGSFLRTESWPHRPDVVVLAKALGGGLVPLSAMLTTAALFQRAYGANFEMAEAHNATFAWNALGAVAALAALELVDAPILDRVRAAGRSFVGGLRESLAGSSLFSEVRGEGFMIGVALRQPDHPWLSFEHFGYTGLDGRPAIAGLLCYRLYRRGFYAFVCAHDWSVLRIQPRFDIPDATLASLTAAIRDELAALAALA
ncbi:MAG: aminotransferase class III-fold pyridoxal phosphate-dependent enzyme [Acidobacteriota bacterium]